MQIKMWQIVNKQYRKISVVGIFALAFFALCFSLRGSIEAQGGKMLSNENNSQTNYAVPAFEDARSAIVLDAPTNEKISQNFLKNGTGQRSGPDNSEISASYDAFGATSEMRSFQDNPRILMIVVETAPDGTKTARASSRSGEMRQLPADLVDRALYASGNQLADALGFIEPVKPLEIIVPPETALTDAVEPQASPMVLENNTASTDKRNEQRLNPAPLATESVKTVEINAVLPKSVKPESQPINNKD